MNKRTKDILVAAACAVPVVMLIVFGICAIFRVNLKDTVAEDFEAENII